MRAKLVLAALVVLMAAAPGAFAQEWDATVSSGSVTVYFRTTKSSTRVGYIGAGGTLEDITLLEYEANGR